MYMSEAGMKKGRLDLLALLRWNTLVVDPFFHTSILVFWHLNLKFPSSILWGFNFMGHVTRDSACWKKEGF